MMSAPQTRSLSAESQQLDFYVSAWAKSWREAWRMVEDALSTRRYNCNQNNQHDRHCWRGPQRSWSSCTAAVNGNVKHSKHACRMIAGGRFTMQINTFYICLATCSIKQHLRHNKKQWFRGAFRRKPISNIQKGSQLESLQILTFPHLETFLLFSTLKDKIGKWCLLAADSDSASLKSEISGAEVEQRRSSECKLKMFLDQNKCLQKHTVYYVGIKMYQLAWPLKYVCNICVSDAWVWLTCPRAFQLLFELGLCFIQITANLTR